MEKTHKNCKSLSSGHFGRRIFTRQAIRSVLECVLNHQSHRSGRIGSEGLCVAQNSYV